MQIGIDEVGRGAWAGPLVVCAVVADPSAMRGIKDSKQTSPLLRRSQAEFIRSAAQDITIAWISPQQIDRSGLSASMNTAVQRVFSSLSKLNLPTIIDGNINYLVDYENTRAQVKADTTEPVVSAASIIAKLARDDYMRQMANLFPEYGFERHVGYGTAEHRTNLSRFGATVVHRHSYRPVGEAQNEFVNRRRRSRTIGRRSDDQRGLEDSQP